MNEEIEKVEKKKEELEKKKKELRSYFLRSDNLDFGELSPAQVAVKAAMFVEGLLNADNQNHFFLEEITGIKLSPPKPVTPQTLFGNNYIEEDLEDDR